MSPNKKDDKKQKDEDEGGTDGQSGSIEFAEFIGTGDRLSDDKLPPDVKRRLLDAHARKNEASVKKQKAKRDSYKELKEGKTNLQDFRQGMGHGQQAGYKQHPELANKAQFSGVDPEVSMIPDDNDMKNTNDEARNELENQYRLQNRPEQAPTFNPKPQGPTG